MTGITSLLNDKNQKQGSHKTKEDSAQQKIVVKL